MDHTVSPYIVRLSEKRRLKFAGNVARVR